MSESNALNHIRGPPEPTSDDTKRVLRYTMACVCAVFTVLLIATAFSASPGGMETGNGTGSKQVFVFRHCVRAPTDKIKYAHPDFQKFSDYTSKGYPSWEVPANWCMPNGVTSMVGEGRALTQFGGRFDQGLRVYADALNRDVQTALDLLRGLERENTVEFIGHLFDTLDPEHLSAAENPTPLCELDRETEDAVASTIADRLKTLPPPFPYNASARSLQAKLGKGHAPAIIDLPNEVIDGKLHGGFYLMKSFSQAFFYSFASGMDYMQRLNITVNEMYEYVSFQFYYRALTHWTAQDVSKSAGLVRYVLSELEDSSNGVTIFVGHDSDLDSLAMYFDLQWDAPPYCCKEYYPTPPGSGLMFELSEGRLTSSFLYPIYTNADGTPNVDGNLTRVSAKEEMDYGAWKQLAFDTLDKYPLAKECYNKFNPREAPPPHHI